MYKWLEIILLAVIPLAWGLTMNVSLDAILRRKPPRDNPAEETPQEPSS